AGSSVIRTFLNGSTILDSRFGQGTFDYQHVSGCANPAACWSYQAKTTNQKTTINAAYAAGYVSPVDNHFMFVFGGDRASNNGSTFIGLWLLQDKNVAPIGTSGGGFTGDHV